MVYIYIEHLSDTIFPTLMVCAYTLSIHTIELIHKYNPEHMFAISLNGPIYVVLALYTLH